MSAVAPASIMLVSNSFAVFGSLGPVPLVTVCGKVSLLVTVILSPFLTVIVSGSKSGLPCTDAPASIVRGFPAGPAVALVVAVGGAAVALVVAAGAGLVVAAPLVARPAVALVVAVGGAAVALVVAVGGAAVALVVAVGGALVVVAGPLGPACTTSFPVMYG
jgi:hypothetical protein